MVEDLCYLSSPCIKDTHFPPVAPREYELSIMHKQYWKGDVMEYWNVIV